MFLENQICTLDLFLLLFSVSRENPFCVCRCKVFAGSLWCLSTKHRMMGDFLNTHQCTPCFDWRVLCAILRCVWCSTQGLCDSVPNSLRSWHTASWSPEFNMAWLVPQLSRGSAQTSAWKSYVSIILRHKALAWWEHSSLRAPGSIPGAHKVEGRAVSRSCPLTFNTNTWVKVKDFFFVCLFKQN